MISTIVVYLCGDLGAQLLFPPDNGSPQDVQAGDQKQEAGNNAGGIGGGYDPWRTVRHLTVGVGSAIPTYKW